MQRRIGRPNLLVGASLTMAMALVASPSALAQETTGSDAVAQPQDTPQAADPPLDIIVTAQRRAESKQNVPVTITVLDEKLIQDARISAVDDITRHTPGVGFTSFPASEPRVAVRGIGSPSRGAAGDPSSAVFIDEIYNGRPSGIAFEPFDVARIEVLKGPQGTLFGRNVTGGAINIVTNRPELDTFDASAEASYGNYNQVDAAGFLNIPITNGTAALRFGGALHRHDGYVDRIDQAGNKIGELDDKDTYSGRVQLLVEPASNVRLHLTAETATDRNKGPGQRIVNYSQPSGGFVDRFFVDPFRYKTYATIDGRQNRDVWDVRFKGEVDTSFATISYLGSYKHLEYDSYYDFDGSLSKLTGVDQTRDIEGGDNESSDLMSHELQLKSLPQSDVKWVLGLYKYNADTRRISTTRSLRNPAVRTETIDQDASVDSIAGYVDVTYPITSRINVFGGLRYTNDDKDVRTIGQISNSQIFFVTSPYDVRAQKSWGALSWRAGADVHATRDLMFYGSVSRGFKSGGFQDTPATAQDAALAVNPEYATSYELGQRGKFLDGHVIWNNSVYYTKYTDLQTRLQQPNLVTSIINAFAEIYGAETELNVNFGSGLRLNLGYAYTHARYTDYPALVGGVAVNYKGNHLDWTPDHKLTASPSYRFGLANGGSLEIAADYAYESMIYDNESNNIFQSRKPTNFLDARVVFQAPGNHLTFSIWGKNLTKEFTKTYDGRVSGVTVAAYVPPRTYGATVRWRY